jgi:hypothetical protein
MEVPASIDRVEAEDIRFAKPQINLSESLGRVPGIVVQNRQNYAQDLQISSRGFGGPLDLRHPRPAPHHRRHPRELSGRPGPGVAFRPWLRRARRGACAGRSP